MKIYINSNKNSKAIKMDKFIMTKLSHPYIIKAIDFMQNEEVSVLVTDLYTTDFREL